MEKDIQKVEAFFREGNEARFDTRLIEKKLEHGFLTRAEKEAFLKNLPAESDFDFTRAEALDAEDQ